MNIEYNVYWDRRSERKTSQYVRVVKEADSKSAGFSRAGSNPAADVFLTIKIPINHHNTELLKNTPAGFFKTTYYIQ